MASISLLNPKAEFARAAQALAVNISAAKGIQDVMKTNLGPKGTMKMLVSGAGDTIVRLQEEGLLNEEPIGLDLSTGEPMKPVDMGIFDNYIVKKQILNSSTIIAVNILLVDEIMRAGMSSLKG